MFWSGHRPNNSDVNQHNICKNSTSRTQQYTLFGVGRNIDNFCVYVCVRPKKIYVGFRFLLMHLSMLTPRGGGREKGGDLINQVVPWVGIWTDTFF